MDATEASKHPTTEDTAVFKVKKRRTRKSDGKRKAREAATPPSTSTPLAHENTQMNSPQPSGAGAPTPKRKRPSQANGSSTPKSPHPYHGVSANGHTDGSSADERTTKRRRKESRGRSLSRGTFRPRSKSRPRFSESDQDSSEDDRVYGPSFVLVALPDGKTFMRTLDGKCRQTTEAVLVADNCRAQIILPFPPWWKLYAPRVASPREQARSHLPMMYMESLLLSKRVRLGCDCVLRGTDMTFHRG